jgi:hypothetical protein
MSHRERASEASREISQGTVLQRETELKIDEENWETRYLGEISRGTINHRESKIQKGVESLRNKISLRNILRNVASDRKEERERGRTGGRNSKMRVNLQSMKKKVSEISFRRFSYFKLILRRGPYIEWPFFWGLRKYEVCIGIYSVYASGSKIFPL